MAVRAIKAAIVFVALLGMLYAAVRYPPIGSRASLVYRRASGGLPGVGWRELIARVAPESMGMQELIAPGPDSFVRKLDYPTQIDEDWKMYPVFLGRTGCLNLLDVHFSVLKAGKTPHDLHQHWAEEVLIPFSGESEILRAAEINAPEPEVARIGPGQFVYHPSGQVHTIRGVEPGPSTYVVLRWENGPTGPTREAAPALLTDYRELLQANKPSAGNEPRAGLDAKLLFESPTLHLDKLQSHTSTLPPGSGYDAHGDPYDVVILLLEGAVETIGQQVSAPSIIVYSAYEPHGMNNPGATPAKYVVFEFHGCGPT